MNRELQQRLRNRLWTVANTLRGNMSAGDFMYYTLGFIFFRYLSEREEACAGRLVPVQGAGFRHFWTTADESQRHALREACIRELGYFLAPEHLFSAVVSKAEENGYILAELEAALKSIEACLEENSVSGSAPMETGLTDEREDIPGLFSDIDLSSPRLGKTSEDRNRLIGGVLKELAGIDFCLNEAEGIDILGDAYEYMIGMFAAGAGRKSGEFYTPQEVSQVLAGIVVSGKGHPGSVYDPACGSGSLLLRAAREGKAGKIYAQEKNPTVFNLCRMNMMLHGMGRPDFRISLGDTLEEDGFPSMKFDAIVANPPFSAAWSASDRFISDPRFSGPGVLAPKSKADYAFILHMLSHLSDNGTMACVAPLGVLFRGASEGKIRRYLVEENYLDAVIGLPANIFYGTTIPTCILVLRKNRRPGDKVLFIDASRDFEKARTRNRLLPEHVGRIVETYRSRKEADRYSRPVALTEISGNGYNLNIPRYIDTFEEEPPADINAIMKEIKDLEAEKAELDRQIDVYLKELGLLG